MDPNNPVVKLCTEGMQAEAQGQLDEARSLFMRAWDKSQDDFEACIAAHYVARHQDTPEETLRWNLEALARAQAVADERVRGFYPSLYLNMGWSYENTGDKVKAQEYYELAATCIDDLPAGPYRDMVLNGIRQGEKRIESGGNQS
jgi:tetratricopeptide (TPR) repeat protein